MYVLLENSTVKKYPYTLDMLYGDNPNVSFPAQITTLTLKEFNVEKVYATKKPEVGYQFNVVELDPVLINGKWTQNWAVFDATTEEIEQRTLNKSNEVRDKRDSLLSKSDYTQLPDSNRDKELWAIYRQQLRDIPEQEGFPWNIIWPRPPV